MSPSRCTLAVLVGLFLAAPDSAIAADSAEQRFVGYLGDESGLAYHRAGQGGLHQLILTDGVQRARAARYRVCLRGGNARIKRCWTRRSRPGEADRLNVSLLINDRGGPGRYIATWSVGGKQVASWPFRLYPEEA